MYTHLIIWHLHALRNIENPFINQRQKNFIITISYVKKSAANRKS